MTYKAPELALEVLRRTIDPANLDIEGTLYQADLLLTVVTPVIARDIVAMVDAALTVVEQHDPSCLSLYAADDDTPCDCSWQAIAGVVAQLKAKVGIVT